MASGQGPGKWSELGLSPGNMNAGQKNSQMENEWSCSVSTYTKGDHLLALAPKLLVKSLFFQIFLWFSEQTNIILINSSFALNYMDAVDIAQKS